MNSEPKSVLMDKNVVEFTTVAVEFCHFLESTETRSRRNFVDVALKLLPLLYLKASLIEPLEMEEEMELEEAVTEDTYEVLRMAIAQVMGEQDDYLDVFVQEMKYSDKPVLKTISEDLADIYQDISNFLFVFRMGLETTMHDALAQVQQHFEMYWGQTLVNTLRALHDVRYHQTIEEEQT
ncbi:MAG: DUF5063 domain-containing protein, partial [Bacteroidaceae bacterium]|nr:DUF5063 domain-containing protein [Bacteroidaceae bacterium]